MTDIFIEKDYNKVNRRGLRYSWPLQDIEVYRYDSLALSLVVQKWDCSDCNINNKDKMPDAIGLYMIVGSILNPIRKSTDINIVDNKLLNTLNCVLYVGQGNIRARYTTHVSNPRTDRMKNAIDIYKPKFYYIQTDNIELDSYMDDLEIDLRTKIYESALIQFFGPPVNEQSGRDITNALDSNRNMGNNSKIDLFIRRNK